MEITRTPPIQRIAQTSPEAPPRAEARAGKALARRAEAKQAVSETLAKAILADSGFEPVDIFRFNVHLDIHKETGRVVAEIQNKKTGEILQKIPSETILRGAVMLERELGTILDTPA